MKKYSVRGMQSINGDFDRWVEVGEAFAGRIARREFGKSGVVRTVNMGSYSQDGSVVEFNAFIGITKGSETTGRNFHFTVTSK